MSCQEKDRIGVLKDIAQSCKKIQELKESWRARLLFNKLAGEMSSTTQESVLQNNTTPLQRNPSDATKPNKQQAVVQSLQVSQLQHLQQLAVINSLSASRRNENIMETSWESQLDTSVIKQSRQKILQALNTGSFKELKGLQQTGVKEAKLILGWREIHGHFTKLEDLVKVEGMTELRFSSFMKANSLSTPAGLLAGGAC
uniref:Uncharacterized protein n=1 Tax=Monopterus albus TaxID=43700 RepID=A0A3Q3QRA1_MONAL